MMYFYDSYAVIEYFKGSESHKKYFEEDIGVLAPTNLIEIHHAILREFSEKEADEFTRIISVLAVDPDIEILIAASKFRKANNKSGLSYADCIGYVYAIKNGMKFLTGDPAFRGFPGVEFVS